MKNSLIGEDTLGLFISFEGGEGSGKSSQCTVLYDRLIEKGYRVTRIQEPGSTELGNYLRSYLKATKNPVTPEAEVLLFAAARTELVRRVILPELVQGRIVIADRYADSTTAYQGYGRRVSLSSIKHANDLATNGHWPDLTFLLDVPIEIGLNRARVQTSLDDERDFARRNTDGSKRADESEEQRFEGAGKTFHKRVREGYLKLAAREPDRWIVLDATAKESVLSQQIWDYVSQKLNEKLLSEGDTARLPGF